MSFGGSILGVLVWVFRWVEGRGIGCYGLGLQVASGGVHA